MVKKIERPTEAVEAEKTKAAGTEPAAAGMPSDKQETTGVAANAAASETEGGKAETAASPPAEAKAVEPPLKDTADDEPAPESDIEEDIEVNPLNISPSGQVPKHHRLWHAVKAHKWRVIVAGVVAIVLVLLAVPVTRYALAGTVIRKDFTVVVLDSQTNKPVTSAVVRLAGKTATTDSQGTAKIRTNVGNARLEVAKKYYKDASASVLIPFNQKQPYSMTFEATGRQVPVAVVDKIGGKPVGNAKVAAESSEVLTDKNGEATIVLPASSKEVKGSITADGYNKADVTIKVTTAKDEANRFSVTPRGKLYFLSNASGKIDVVKSDMDGRNRETVLAGTGKEDRSNTVLFASTDWRYLALLSKRDSDQPKLHLIETETDKMTTMDEGDAIFTMVGWNGHQFLYKVSRNNIKSWQPKQEALKSFDAETKKLATLDETTAEGSFDYHYLREYIGQVYILDNEIVYSKNWASAGYANNQGISKQATLNAVKQTAASRRTLKSFARSDSAFPSIDMRPYAPNELYVQSYEGSRQMFYEYVDGKVEEAKGLTDTTYYASYPTYLISPDAQRNFWNDSRDGKNALFVGDRNAKDAKQVALLKDYRAYGWYTNKYLLLSKEGSELYIMPDSGLKEGQQPSKVSDYYRPDFTYNGYGRGYGGQ